MRKNQCFHSRIEFFWILGCLENLNNILSIGSLISSEGRIISSLSTIPRESVIVTKKLLKVSATSDSFDTIFPSSINVMRDVAELLSEIKGLTVFQNFLLSVTSEISS